MPYSQPTDGASMTYKFNLTEDVENLSAVIAVNATLTFYRLEGHRYMVSLDGGDEIEVVFNERLNEDQRNIYSVYYPTVATRVKDDRVQLGKAAKGEHTLTIRPIEPGTVFEKIVIDAGDAGIPVHQGELIIKKPSEFNPKVFYYSQFLKSPD